MALTDAIKVLVDFAADRVSSLPPEEQIKIYWALSETLTNPAARAQARELAVTQSKIAALQLDFQGLLTSQGDGH